MLMLRYFMIYELYSPFILMLMLGYFIIYMNYSFRQKYKLWGISFPLSAFNPCICEIWGWKIIRTYAQAPLMYWTVWFPWQEISWATISFPPIVEEEGRIGPNLLLFSCFMYLTLTERSLLQWGILQPLVLIF